MFKKQKNRDVTLRLYPDDEVLQREVKKFGGNASHIILPSKHVGKFALIVLSKEEAEDKAGIVKKKNKPQKTYQGRRGEK